MFVPVDLEEQKLLATDVYGTTLVGVEGNYDDVNRLCTELASERGWAFVNVNLRPYYAEGSKTLAYETVEQLGWRLPDKIVCADRLRLAVHEDRPRLRRVARPRPRRRRAAELPRRPGGRLRPGRATPSPTATTSAARSSPTRSPRASRSATRPTVPTRSISRATTGGSIDSVTDDEIRAGIRLLAETTGIFTETAGGVTTATLAKLADAGELGSDDRVVVYITGEGLKTLDAVRDGFAMHEIEPTLDSFAERVPERSPVTA